MQKYITEHGSYALHDLYKILSNIRLNIPENFKLRDSSTPLFVNVSNIFMFIYACIHSSVKCSYHLRVYLYGHKHVRIISSQINSYCIVLFAFSKTSIYEI